MTQIQDFKDNAYQSVWDHAKAIFKPMIIITLLGYAAMYIIGLIVSELFVPGLLSEYLGIVSSGSDFSTQSESMQILIQDMRDIPGIGLIVTLSTIVMMIITSWVMHLRLLISQDSILDKSEPIMSAIRRAFSNKVWSIFFSYLLIMIVAIALFVPMAFIAAAGSMFLVILYMALVGVVLVRFIGTASAIVHGDLIVMEAIKFSFRNITFGRAFKIFGIFIGAGLLMVIASGLVSIILGLLGVAGVVLNIVVSFLLGVFVSALMTSLQSGIFFRYADVEIEDSQTQPDQHLVE
jgi:hypothetical protein